MVVMINDNSNNSNGSYDKSLHLLVIEIIRQPHSDAVRTVLKSYVRKHSQS